MESIDPRTPVLVGCGQVVQRKGELARAREPLELMREALERAAEDAGAPGLLSAADSIRVPRGVWEYANPAGWLAERLGAAAPETALGPISGSTVQRMLSHAACEIVAGRRDVVLVTGAECEHSKRRARASGTPLGSTECPGTPDETFGSHDPGFGPVERRYRIRPIQAFSLFENALRHRLGESPEECRTHISELWARLAQVAAGNPYAWIRDAPSAEAIRTPGPSNRMVAYPYTKLLVANMVVDMGAAVIICSVEAARRHGVSDDRFIFLHAATDVLATPPLTDRLDLCEQTGIGIAGLRALELADLEPGDLAEVDLYSCFPSAVRIAARELGISLDRDVSLTGGLTFAGGPFNSYVLHSLATLMGRLRGRPDARGLATGVGGYMAKHAAAVYGAAPPRAGFAYADCTQAALAAPTRSFDPDFEGPVRVESFAQLQGREGDDFLLVACLSDDGRRTFATFADARAPELESQDFCGRSGRVRAGELVW